MAGKARKAREHRNKMRDKRARKAAKKQLYTSLAGSSHKNKKVRRANANAFSFGRHKHLMPYCGNTGCARCFRIWPPGAAGKLERRVA